MSKEFGPLRQDDSPRAIEGLFESEWVALGIVGTSRSSDPARNERYRNWAAPYLHLFLAAPDLLTACEGALLDNENLWDLEAQEGLSKSIVDTLRAAVAKARAEQ